MSSKASLHTATPGEIRAAIRTGTFSGETAGLAGGYLQGNLVILPRQYAEDFLRFCQRNPKSCPLIAVSDPGDPSLPTLGRDIDIRSDVPAYKIFRDGVFVDQVTDIADLWRDDLVSFLLGCSFTFEEALINEGVEVRHISCNSNVPMYRTNIQTVPAGPFRGEMVVSMRPMSKADLIRAIEITARFPNAHGTPIHFGDPAEIGITEIDKPDFGDAVEIRADELPVFWGCGVTPQVAVTNAKPSLSITHAPGHMLISDIRAGDLGRVAVAAA